MTVGERDEEVWRSIRMLGVDISECRQVAMVVVVVRDELMFSYDRMTPGRASRLTTTSTSGSSDTLAGGAICEPKLQSRGDTYESLSEQDLLPGQGCTAVKTQDHRGTSIPSKVPAWTPKAALAGMQHVLTKWI